MSIRELLNNKEAVKDIALKVFQEADSDNSGSIEVAELADLMNKIHAHLNIAAPSEEFITKTFNDLDLDKNGHLSFDEFYIFATNVHNLYA